MQKVKNKNIGGFFAMLFCTLVIVSTIGNSFGIRNSFAQEQQIHTHPPQQPSTITQQPSTITQQPSTITQQPLCQAGMCNNDTTQQDNVDPQHAVIQLVTNIYKIKKP